MRAHLESPGSSLPGWSGKGGREGGGEEERERGMKGDRGEGKTISIAMHVCTCTVYAYMYMYTYVQFSMQTCTHHPRFPALITMNK